MRDKREDDVPRWQQGPRPRAYGELWDRMTPRQRRRAFITDILFALAGAFVVAMVFGAFDD